jgi:hypothetical protein
LRQEQVRNRLLPVAFRKVVSRLLEVSFLPVPADVLVYTPEEFESTKVIYERE